MISGSSMLRCSCVVGFDCLEGGDAVIVRTCFHFFAGKKSKERKRGRDHGQGYMIHAKPFCAFA